MKLRRALSDPRCFQDQIDRLHLKYAHTPGIYELQQEGIPLSTICLSRGNVARLLARTVSRGKYEVRPASAGKVMVRGKERLLYEFRITDRIIHGVFGSLIAAATMERLSPNLYSYIPGRTWWLAITRFASFVRAHSRSRPDPRTRGLYVLRRDIHQYADSIPLAPDSELWSLLGDALFPRRAAPPDLWSLLLRLVRPEAHFEGGGLATRLVGVPTGSPIAPPIFNLYLTSVDHALGSVPGAFYARYCDDILFAHADPEVARQADRDLGRLLARLRLQTHPDKDKTLYFNGASRRSREWPTTVGSSAVAFLGCRLNFDGTVSLGRKKQRNLLKDLDRRAGRTFALLGCPAAPVAGPSVCATVNAALDPNAAVHHKAAPLLRCAITDRAQLKHLDYRIALGLVHLLSGVRGPRAFRRIPYRTLRRDWRLVSLYHSRNRHGRRRPVSSCAR